MHTEDEAKKLWCPHVRFNTTDLYRLSFNNRINSPAEFTNYDGPEAVVGTSRCLASDCAAWRWAWRHNVPEKMEFFAMGQKPEGDGWVCKLSDEGRETMMIKSRWERPNPHPEGYCGLAGKP